MAYPTIESITTGTDTGSSVDITMPSGLVKDELILVYMCTYRAYYISIASSSGNFVRLTSVTDAYADRATTIFYAKAKQGSANNNLTVNISSGTNATCYVVYRISGHGIYLSSDINNDVLGTVYTSGITYQTLPLSATTSGDSLYIASILYTTNIVDMSNSVGWSNFDTETASVNNIAVQSIQNNSGSIIAYDWSHTPYGSSRTYVSTILRVKEGSLGLTSNGIGIFTQNGRVGIL